MKRPLAVIGLTGLIAQCLAMWINPSFSLIAGAVLLGAWIVLLLNRSDRALRAAVCAAGAVMVLTGAFQQIRVAPVRALDGEIVTVVGTAAGQNESDGAYLTVKNARIVSTDGRTLADRQVLRIYLSAPIDAAPYDAVTVRRVRLSAPRDGFGLSSRGYFESMGIYVTGSASSYGVSAHPAKRPWYAFVSDIRSAMQRAVRTMLPESAAGIIDAMVLGDRRSLSAETLTAFRRCGLSAMLVVSGMHLSFLIGGLMRLLSRGIPYRLAALICIPVTVLLTAITGFTGSGVRAGVSMTIYLLAMVAGRHADPINSLGAAAIVLMVTQPLCAGNVGVQLSFLSTAGILYGVPIWTKRVLVWLPPWAHRDRPRALLELIMVSVTATAATAPLTALVFGEWPVIGVGMNLLAAVPAQFLLLTGACAAGFGALGWAALARPAAWAAGQAAQLLKWGTAVCSRCPVLTDPDGALTVWTALVIAVIGVVMICNASAAVRRIAAVCCAVLLAVPVWCSVRPREAVTAVRCGDGLAVCVETGGRRILVLDGESASMERNTCRAFAGVRIDEVLILSPDANFPARTAAALARGRGAGRIYYAGTACPDALRRIGSGRSVRPMDEWIRPSENFRIFSGSDGGWVRIGSVLISYGAADTADLPMWAHRASVWVTTQVPAGAAAVRAEATVLSCAGWTELPRLSRLTPVCGTVVATSQNGVLRIPLDQKGVRIWRS